MRKDDAGGYTLTDAGRAYLVAESPYYFGCFYDAVMARKSFESLPSGGRIVIHEILFNDGRTGPFSAAAFNINMVTLMAGEQYSGREISGFLREAGFRQIEVKPTFGYWSIVTAVKP